MRAQGGSKPVTEIGRDYLNYYAKTLPPRSATVSDPVFAERRSRPTLSSSTSIYEVPASGATASGCSLPRSFDGYLTPSRGSPIRPHSRSPWASRSSFHRTHPAWPMDGTPSSPRGRSRRRRPCRFPFPRGPHGTGESSRLTTKYEALARLRPRGEDPRAPRAPRQDGKRWGYTLEAEPTAPAKAPAPPVGYAPLLSMFLGLIGGWSSSSWSSSPC